MNSTEELIFEDLKHHIKIHDICYVNDDNVIFSCEIDKIQSVSRGIINSIIKNYGKYSIISSTKNVKNLGFTKIFICREKSVNNEN